MMTKKAMLMSRVMSRVTAVCHNGVAAVFVVHWMAKAEGTWSSKRQHCHCHCHHHCHHHCYWNYYWLYSLLYPSYCHCHWWWWWTRTPFPWQH